MNVMTAPDVWADQTRELTVADMENMPDDEFRYELDDGVLIVSPSPSRCISALSIGLAWFSKLPVRPSMRYSQASA